MKYVCILDYGSGNVRSVYNMLYTIEKNTVISNKPKDIHKATHLILPGVGAFKYAMENIRNKLPINTIEKEIFKKNKPFLGICVGMQVLANIGYEFEETKGLGWIPGIVHRLKTKKLPIPHVGWNNILIKKRSPLFYNLNSNTDLYFVHSFAFYPKNKINTLAQTEYGEKFTSVIQVNNIFGVQFHPEKSQKAGRVLLENFIKYEEK